MRYGIVLFCSLIVTTFTPHRDVWGEQPVPRTAGQLRAFTVRTIGGTGRVGPRPGHVQTNLANNQRSAVANAFVGGGLATAAGIQTVKAAKMAFPNALGNAAKAVSKAVPSIAANAVTAISKAAGATTEAAVPSNLKAAAVHATLATGAAVGAYTYLKRASQQETRVQDQVVRLSAKSSALRRENTDLRRQTGALQLSTEMLRNQNGTLRNHNQNLTKKNYNLKKNSSGLRRRAKRDRDKAQREHDQLRSALESTSADLLFTQGKLDNAVRLNAVLFQEAMLAANVAGQQTARAQAAGNRETVAVPVPVASPPAYRPPGPAKPKLGPPPPGMYE